jgi:16S rRNA (uracil1498-N3)-methyltransferase
VRRRFFVAKFSGPSAVIEGETAHHLGRVLRAEPGQLYELSDGSKVWLGRIETVNRDRVEFALVEEIPSHPGAVDLTLLLAVVKFDAFEWAIEKATELGVSTIVPLAAARSEKALLAAAGKRAERWKKLLLEASQQSRRLCVPVLAPLAQPHPAFTAASGDVKVVLSERPGASPLRDVLERDGAVPWAKIARAALAIGPEGGWTEEEFGAAARSGFQEASLGQLILRTETAVAAVLASFNYALGK